MTFGEKCQKLRKARGLTQEELAQQLGVSRQALSKWESDAVLPDTANVVKLCDLFGVATDYLLRDGPQETAQTAVPESAPSPESAPHRPGLAGMILGSVTAVLSALGLLALGIWGSLGDYEIFYPVEIPPGTDDTEIACTAAKRGFAAFLEVRNLEWLFWLLAALALTGIVWALLSWRKRRRA